VTQPLGRPLVVSDHTKKRNDDGVVHVDLRNGFHLLDVELVNPLSGQTLEHVEGRLRRAADCFVTLPVLLLTSLVAVELIFATTAVEHSRFLATRTANAIEIPKICLR
jgi:hypothetical protein